MLRGYKYRIYPTEEQQELLAKHFGCVRFVYNWALDTKSRAWKDEQRSVSCSSLIVQLASDLKVNNEWLSEVNSQSLQYSIRQMDAAYQNFFKKNAKFPNFKKKFGVQRCNFPQNNRADFRHGLLEIMKFRGKNAIRCKFHRRFYGELKRVTIIKECDGRYYATCLVEDSFTPLPQKKVLRETAIGIDTGLTHFATLSTGEKIASPKMSKNASLRLARLQRSLSRKKKGSSNYAKAKLHIARLHSKVAHRRSDFLHKLTYRLTHENQVSCICVEDLNVKGMMKNHHLAYSIADAGLGEFYRQLAYKCEWYGVAYRVIDRFAPSSKLCHHCGYRMNKMPLSVRRWTCPKCGTHHDRDINAAKNIKELGLMALPVQRGEVKPVEKPPVDDRATKHLRSDAPKKQEKSVRTISQAAKSLD